MKIYISGKIGDLPETEYRAKFAEARQAVLDAGHEPCCPVHDVDHDHPDRSWNGYMRRDVKALMDCDRILLLPCWEDSPGARTEASIAQQLGIWAIHGVEQLSRL